MTDEKARIEAEAAQGAAPIAEGLDWHEFDTWLRYLRELRDSGHLTEFGRGALVAIEKWLSAPRAEGLDDDIRRDIRAAQVQIAEATWRLGRDHPEFHTLQRALSRLNRASRPPDEREPGASHDR